MMLAGSRLLTSTTMEVLHTFTKVVLYYHHMSLFFLTLGCVWSFCKVIEFFCQCSQNQFLSCLSFNNDYWWLSRPCIILTKSQSLLLSSHLTFDIWNVYFHNALWSFYVLSCVLSLSQECNNILSDDLCTTSLLKLYNLNCVFLCSHEGLFCNI